VSCWNLFETVSYCCFSVAFNYVSSVNSVKISQKVVTSTGKLRLLIRTCLVNRCLHVPVEILVSLHCIYMWLLGWSNVNPFCHLELGHPNVSISVKLYNKKQSDTALYIFMLAHYSIIYIHVLCYMFWCSWAIRYMYISEKDRSLVV
jgi:hypothetical protein